MYTESGYRIKFLQGYQSSDGNGICYKYKLHEYKHKRKEASDINGNDTITWSIQVCPNKDNAFGKVSDYLSNVVFAGNNNAKDNYYVDDTHFYYVSHGRQDAMIELCFTSGEEDDIEEASIVTQTEYCIKDSSAGNDNNNEFLCSKRGVAITDICGLDSVARQQSSLPATSIDYVPKPGHIYEFSCFFFVSFSFFFFLSSDGLLFVG